MSDAIPNRLLRIPEAARYLGSTISAVRALIWSRELPYVKIGQRYLIDRADLDAFIQKTKKVA
jgi:excisionase family DNA binding protein